MFFWKEDKKKEIDDRKKSSSDEKKSRPWYDISDDDVLDYDMMDDD